MIKEVLYLDLNAFSIPFSNNPFIKYIGYFINKEIIGYISYEIKYEKAEIVNIYVKEAYRNRKIGSNMLEYLIKSLKKLYLDNITLEVNINNKYAILLYEKYGFRNVAFRKLYYNGEDGLLMELIL